MKFETKAIRIQTNRSGHREHSTPIFPTSSFVFEDAAQMRQVFAGEEPGNIYSRFTNPSVKEFEDKIAALEGVERAMATATGMAAIFASLLAFLKQGDHLIASRAVFGSTFQVLKTTLPEYGIECSFIDPIRIGDWENEIRPNTKMLFLETPSNPGLAISDLEQAAVFCKKHNLLFNVDNCFATPYLQNPAVYGADIITHSATKFIDGQGRVLGGVIAGSKEVIEKVYLFIRRTGASLSPFNAWILSKSLETLAVRMDRHCENALKLAHWLESHPKTLKVNYPFLISHPQYEVAKKQMRQGGGILTFEIEGGVEAGARFLDRLKMLSLTANLGDSRSIASHPASTTHLRIPIEDRLKIGITDGLIRISIGLEHIDDIIEDIENALG
ncbi:MAG: O-succinylhomoserine sulfhydrylase [Saprospiraceae bacterium]|jgi:O-succinylhomoserine sulfhydrylase